MAVDDPPPARDLLAGLATTAGIQVQEFDLVRNTAVLAQFSEAQIVAASFLDNRMQAADTPTLQVPLQALIERANLATEQGMQLRPLHFIFHTGHVGSTLLSRLLESAGGVLGLREPFALRQLADAKDADGLPEAYLAHDALARLFDSFLTLWSRGFSGTTTVVLKASSNTGRIAPLLLAMRPQSRAAYLNVGAEVYLATILANPYSLHDLMRLAPERIRRLRSFGMPLPAPLHLMTRGELAAMSWLVESWSQRNAVAAAPGQVITVDFDALLTDLRGEMECVLRHFALPHDEQTLAQVAGSLARTRYSKDQQYEFTPELRARILADARTRHGEDIRKGLEWLGRVSALNADAAKVVSGGT